jgi:peptide-methionine (R)-S-oxide reductase
VKPILTRIWVFLVTSALVVGTFAFHARGQDFSERPEQQGRDSSTASDGKAGSASDAAGSDQTANAAAAKNSDGKPDPKAKAKSKSKARVEPEFVRKTDAEWRRILTKTQYMVTRQKATEPAYSGKYATGHFRGVFHCVCCDAELFSGESKFESGTGWPSFDRPASARSVARAMDYDAFEPRIEVMCRRCGAHLGHVFDDGPTITGLRFCINSAAIKLEPPEGESTSTKASSRTASRSRAKARAKATTKARAKAKAKSTQPPSQSQESPGSAQDDKPAETDAARTAKPAE